MQYLRIISSLPMICRHFSTDFVKQNSYANREAKFLTKIMRGSLKRRKWYTERDVTPTPFSIMDPKKPTSPHVVRRMNILNKIFMERITDLMSTGEASVSLLTRDIEIVNVKITQDFRLINIFWADHSKENHAVSTEELLNDCAHTLRHELSQQRVISNVPIIKFVKFKELEWINEVERRLQIADYGEDHECSVYQFSETRRITSNNVPESTALTAKDTEDMFYVTLPEMQNDVFGLDHHKIMTKIKVCMKKSKTTKQKSAIEIPSDASNISRPENSATFITQKEHDQKFDNFLKQRAILQKKQYGMTATQKQMRHLPFGLASEYSDTNDTDDDDDEYYDDDDDDDDDEYYDDEEYEDEREY